MKEYCRYSLLDNQTGIMLVCGVKLKDCKEFLCNGYFYDWFRKITEYEREVKVKGRNCHIFYWTNVRDNKTFRFVDCKGKLLNLR
ncbi:MAG: hypothetical protein RRY18_00050 [Clostridia bacterium]